MQFPIITFEALQVRKYKMIKKGNFNYLSVKTIHSDTVLLTNGYQEIKLADIPDQETIKLDEEIFVFVYQDHAGDLVATAKRPFACVGDFACLMVINETELGSFMDLGLDTPLFVPFSNQEYPFEVGVEYVVYIFLDNSGILTASSWLEDHTDPDIDVLDEGEEVSLLICDASDREYYAIVNNRYMGALYRHEVYETLHIGDSLPAFIRKLKPEQQKVELSLNQPGFEFIVSSKDVVLAILRENKGVLDLGDKSAPEEIHKRLKISKKAFKQIIGGLYKDRLITISDYQIRLAGQE